MSPASTGTTRRVLVSPGRSVFRRLEVIRVHDVTPNMRRIVLGGEELAGFAFHERAIGPYVKLYIPTNSDSARDWPALADDLSLGMLTSDERPAIRTYTARAFDADKGELTIDFVDHGDTGPASYWARHAGTGDVIGLGERGYREANGVDWYILAGDHTALPAIARSLEHLPRGSRGQAIISLPDEVDRQELQGPPGIDVVWLTEHPVSGLPRLVDAVRRSPIPSSAYVFFFAGAEAKAARALRAHARDVLGLPSDQRFILNYWRLGYAEGSFGSEL